MSVYTARGGAYSAEAASATKAGRRTAHGKIERKGAPADAAD